VSHGAVGHGSAIHDVKRWLAWSHIQPNKVRT